jgi:iron complex outermembrane receptor protein
MPRLTALLGLLAVLSTALFAETEIIVTASRVEEDARSTPAYVRVIPEEDIRRGDTVLDALRSLPDVAIRGYSSSEEYVSMGGFGENGYARTIVLIDGRPINRPDMASANWTTIPLDRVERIEVLKGSVSSQYGDQAIAGAINIITKDPEDFEIWASTSLTTDFSNSQTFGLAWTDDVIRVEGGFSRSDQRPKRDRSDSQVIMTHAMIGYRINDLDFELDGFYSFAEYMLPGSISQTDFESDPNQSGSSNDDEIENRYGASLDMDNTLGDWSQVSSISWERTDTSFNLWSFTDSVLDDIHATIQLNSDRFVGSELAISPVLGIDGKWSQNQL